MLKNKQKLYENSKMNKKMLIKIKKPKNHEKFKKYAEKKFEIF